MSAIKNYDEAIKKKSKANSLNLSVFLTYYEKYDILLNKINRKAEAVYVCNEALANVKDKRVIGFINYLKGCSLMETNRHLEAIDAFKLAINHDDSCKEPFSRIGCCLLSIGRNDEAEFYFKKADSQTKAVCQSVTFLHIMP